MNSRGGAGEDTFDIAVIMAISSFPLWAMEILKFVDRRGGLLPSS